ncbi:hypothetical protein KGF56_002249 [Candida oxycetoniae]|uniref:30 kDa heat shock protein n=1 Tax=Candida oxycetoniae TaxID=497107 RepID=A0AAI9SY92_9ASCO|nr:uncharacterized protein KGF56_002249 [Candida oxycetoniae]KAI3404920.1 hypothetical protein KGF56_002249 [Candida oxycetoniae]
MGVLDIYKRAGNQAVELNPPMAGMDIHITEHGSDWLWAAFSLFAFFAVTHCIAYAITSYKTNGLKKVLLAIPIFINVVMSVAYFTYASNLGYGMQVAEFKHVSTDQGLYTRQIFYAKFIGWFLSWPFVLTLFGIITHTTLADDQADLIKRALEVISSIFVRFIATEVYVLGLLIGILIHSTYKWGYFTFAVVAQLFTMYLICVDLHRSFRSANYSLPGNLLIIFEIVVWILYPVCWGLSEGGNVIQPDSEAVFYGILDLITFGILPIILTWLAIAQVDEQYFAKIWAFYVNGAESDPLNEKVGTTPRHSGDTAVPPSGVPEEATTEV